MGLGYQPLVSITLFYSVLPVHLQKPLKSTSLNRHMFFHSQDFPHRCALCSRSFPLKNWLEKHTDVAHAQAGAQKLLCQHCGLTFSSRTLLTQHLEASKCNPARAELLQKRVLSRTSQRFSRNADLPSSDSAGHVCELCGELCQTDWALKKGENKEDRGAEGQNCGPGRSSDLPPGGVFVTDMAVQFRKHLEEMHLDQFDHMDEIIRHVRSYYRPEEDVLACWETEAVVQDEDEPSITRSLHNRPIEGSTNDSTHSVASKTSRKNKPRHAAKLHNVKARKQSKLKKAKKMKNNRQPNVDVVCSGSEEIGIPSTCKKQFAAVGATESEPTTVSSTRTSEGCLPSENQPVHDISTNDSQVTHIDETNDSIITHISAVNDSHVMHTNPTSSYSSGSFATNNRTCFVPQVQPILVQVNPTQNIPRGSTGIVSSCGPTVCANTQQAGGTIVVPTISYHPTLFPPSGPLHSGQSSSSPLPPGPLPSGPLQSGQLPSGLLTPAPLPSGPLPPGPLPSGPLHSASLPSGSLPSRSLPSDPLPLDPLQSGPLPSGPLPSGPLPSGPLPSGLIPSHTVNSASFVMTRFVQPQVLPSSVSTGLPFCPPALPIQLRHTVQPLLITASPSKVELSQIVSSSSLKVQPYPSAPTGGSFSMPQPLSNLYTTSTVFASHMPLVQPIVHPIIPPRLSCGSLNQNSIPNNFISSPLAPRPQTPLLFRQHATRSQVAGKAVSFPSASQSNALNVVFSSANFELPSNCNKQSRLPPSGLKVHRHSEPSNCLDSVPTSSVVPIFNLSHLPSTVSSAASNVLVVPSGEGRNLRSTGDNNYFEAPDARKNSELTVGSVPSNRSPTHAASIPTFTAVIPAIGNSSSDSDSDMPSSFGSVNYDRQPTEEDTLLQRSTTFLSSDRSMFDNFTVVRCVGRVFYETLPSSPPLQQDTIELETNRDGGVGAHHLAENKTHF
ncbi:Zinc finger C2H2-type [Trinorchestia longiramus]|nr:Zinc finger C2H2-type [Trinorchestia longiramus]